MSILGFNAWLVDFNCILGGAVGFFDLEVVISVVERCYSVISIECDDR